MEWRKLSPAFSDPRGEIIDLFPSVPVNVTIIHSRKGAVRGNHYHKETIQCTYVLTGRVKCFSQFEGEEPYSVIADAGEALTHAPNERHAFEALEDTTWIVMTSGPRAGKDYETDTYRLDVPLITQEQNVC